MSTQTSFKYPSLRSNLCLFLCRSRNHTHTLISLGTEDPSSKEHMFWLLEYGFVIDLEWGPNEWFWGRLRTKIRIPFYQYTSHIEYWSIIWREGTESVIIILLNKERLKTKHIIRTFNWFWHNSKPRKIAMLVFFTLSHGILVGAWLK